MAKYIHHNNNVRIRLAVTSLYQDDFRNRVQFLTGLNLVMISISILVDAIVMAEISCFYTTWNSAQTLLSANTALIIIGIDIGLTLLQMLYGVQMYRSISTNAYAKIRRWRIPCSFLVLARIGLFAFYLMSMRISPYHLYFTNIVLLYSVYLFWPVTQFLQHYGTIHTTETTRLLRFINSTV